MFITKDVLPLLGQAGPLESPRKFRAAEAARIAEPSSSSGGCYQSFLPTCIPRVGSSSVKGDIGTLAHLMGTLRQDDLRVPSGKCHSKHS